MGPYIPHLIFSGRLHIFTSGGSNIVIGYKILLPAEVVLCSQSEYQRTWEDWRTSFDVFAREYNIPCMSSHPGSDIDARTRAILWQNGWDYNHGTGHGIGYYLSVHEGITSTYFVYLSIQQWNFVFEKIMEMPMVEGQLSYISVACICHLSILLAGPGRINMGYNSIYTPLYEGMFFSDGKNSRLWKPNLTDRLSNRGIMHITLHYIVISNAT